MNYLFNSFSHCQRNLFEERKKGNIKHLHRSNFQCDYNLCFQQIIRICCLLTKCTKKTTICCKMEFTITFQAFSLNLFWMHNVESKEQYYFHPMLNILKILEYMLKSFTWWKLCVVIKVSNWSSIQITL